MKKPRIAQYDILKGLGILAVVLTHTWLNLDFRLWCQNALMPIFFIATGAFLSVKGTWREAVRRRFARIMVPYFVFAALSFAYWFLAERHFRPDTLVCDPLWEGLNVLFPMNMTRHEPHVYNVVLWFLPCLFVASVLFDLLQRVLRREAWLLGAAVLAAAVTQLVPFWAPFYLPQALAALPFLYFGHVLQKTRETWEPVVCRHLVAAFALASLALVGSFWLTTTCEMRLNRFDDGYLAFLAVALLINLALYVLTLKAKGLRALEWCGANSLAIMLLHEPIKRIVAKAVSLVARTDPESLRISWHGAALTAALTVALCAALAFAYDAVSRGFGRRKLTKGGLQGPDGLSGEEGTRRIGAFQGLRFLAILIVILNHVREFRWWDYNWYACGMGALMYFFALSGFLAGYRDRGSPFSAKETFCCFGRKVARLYPLHFLALVSSLHFLRGAKCLLQGGNPLVNGAWDGWPFAHLLLLQSWMPATYEYFLPLSWFLSTILFLYLVGDLLMPFLRELTVRWHLVLMVVCCLASAILSYAVARSGAPLRLWAQIFPPSRVPEYVAMISLGMICSRRNGSLPMRTGFWGATAIEFVAIGLWLLAAFAAWDWTSVSVRWILPDVALLLAFLPERGLLSRFLGSRVLVWLGGLTLPVYLFHNHILKAMAVVLPGSQKALGLLVSLILVYALAWGIVQVQDRLKGKRRS